MEKTVIEFPPFTLDLINGELWDGSERVNVRPKALALLSYLVKNPGRVITRTELTAAVWPDTYVGDSSVKGYIRDLREALHEEAGTPQFIETVGRRGYRFIVPEQSKGPLMVGSPSLVESDSRLPVGFVGREQELEHLQRCYENALHGERQVVFVTGEAGIGKSTLVEAFLQRIAGDEKSSIERGQCVEQYGQGEAYLPVLEVLARSCRRSRGARMIEILRQYAPTWLVQMPALVPDAEFDVLQRKVHGATRERMLREMAEALEVMTVKQCSVVVLEDLQWSDHATLDLLSYVAQRREPAQLLVIGTFRPTDIVVTNHPLKGIKQDLQGRRLCTELALSLLPEAAVRHYLGERFPHHQFSQEFMQAFYYSTDGNPLFMVNVADYLEEQRIVERVEEYWQLKKPVTEVTAGIPDSLRQMIERQIERLSEEERNILEAGSVVGVDFSSVIVAAAMGLGEGVEHVEEKCEVLVRRKHFLRTNGVTTLPDGTVTERYSFLHALYQHVLVSRLSASRAMRLHRRIGEHLETMYRDQTGEMATELANHFKLGQDYQKAVQYLLQAGKNAIRRSATLEAILHLRNGLALMERFSETTEVQQQELQLQMALGPALIATKGYAAVEVERTYTRALELCSHLAADPQRFQVLYGLWAYYLVRAELEKSAAIGRQLLSLANMMQDTVLRVEAHWALGCSLFWQGELVAAREEFIHSFELYEPEVHHGLTFHYGQDPAVSCLCYMAFILWLLGYPDQALAHADKALARAHQIAHPYDEAFALGLTSMFHQLRREIATTLTRAEQACAISAEQGFPFWEAVGQLMHGWTLRETRQEGFAMATHGLQKYEELGSSVGRTWLLGLVGETASQAGHHTLGLDRLEQSLTAMNTTGERCYAAELYRLKGELVLMRENREQGAESREQKNKVSESRRKGRKSENLNHQSQISDPASEAEKYFRTAITIAQQQQAKSWELRATVSLANLLRRQGKGANAHTMLSEVYQWFTEGSDTADLQEAKLLLRSLRSEESQSI